jgi:hypothetical protein
MALMKNQILEIQVTPLVSVCVTPEGNLVLVTNDPKTGKPEAATHAMEFFYSLGARAAAVANVLHNRKTGEELSDDQERAAVVASVIGILMFQAMTEAASKGGFSLEDLEEIDAKIRSNANNSRN